MIAEYTTTKDKIRKLENSLKHNIMQLMILGGISKGYKNTSEFKEHFNELVSEDNRKYVFGKDGVLPDDYYIDEFIRKAFFYTVNVPDYLNGAKIGTVTYIEGNDADLQYYYECDECGSIIIVDESDNSCEYPIVCKHCHPHATRTHRMIEVGTDDWEKMQPWVEHEKRMNTDENYRAWCEFKQNVHTFWYNITRYVRPGYWKALKKYNAEHGKKKVKPNDEAKNLLVG